MEFMAHLRNSYNFESVQYYNCRVYGRTDHEDGLQLNFGLYDDIHFVGVRLKKGK